jgi:hypothetical protein
VENSPKICSIVTVDVELYSIIQGGCVGNVIVINPFDVPKGQEEQALAMWDRFPEYFRRQPGTSRSSYIGRPIPMHGFIS